MAVARPARCAPDLLEGREVALGAGREVDRVDVPVLVAALVLQVEDVRVVEGPEVDADAAAGVLGDRLGGRQVADRRDPDVQHAVDRRQPGEAGAVGADGDRGALGVAEQQLAREQRGVARRDRRRAGGEGRRQGEGQDCKGLSHDFTSPREGPEPPGSGRKRNVAKRGLRTRNPSGAENPPPLINVAAPARFHARSAPGARAAGPIGRLGCRNAGKAHRRKRPAGRSWRAFDDCRPRFRRLRAGRVASRTGRRIASRLRC